MSDVIYKIIAYEPTEVVKWVYFCRKKTMERSSIDTYYRGTSKISAEVDNRSQNIKELFNVVWKKYKSCC